MRVIPHLASDPSATSIAALVNVGWLLVPSRKVVTAIRAARSPGSGFP